MDTIGDTNFVVTGNFKLEIAGLGSIKCASVRLPSISVSSFRYREGHEKTDIVRNLSISPTYGVLTIKKAVMISSWYDPFNDWVNYVLKHGSEGKFSRKNITITVFNFSDKSDTRHRKINCYNCWPSEIDFGGFSSLDHQVWEKDLTFFIDFMDFED